MKAAVINCVPQGRNAYNLGARKLVGWLGDHGYKVEAFDGDPGLFGYGFDLVCLSVVFSWHAPIAREIALRVKGSAEVWCGGPGMTQLAPWWKRETGLDCHLGLDQRFERQPGRYTMTFASRGCPVAFDETREADDVRRMMAILQEVPARKKQVYVLVGNEPIEACYERALRVIEWGGEPFCQFVRPLNYLGGPLPVRHGWTEQLGRDFCRYFNRRLWRVIPITEYSDRKGEPPPFKDLAA